MECDAMRCDAAEPGGARATPRTGNWSACGTVNGAERRHRVQLRCKRHPSANCELQRRTSARGEPANQYAPERL